MGQNPTESKQELLLLDKTLQEKERVGAGKETDLEKFFLEETNICSNKAKRLFSFSQTSPDFEEACGEQGELGTWNQAFKSVQHSWNRGICDLHSLITGHF